MAAKTLFWKNAVPAGATLHRSLQDGGAAPATATTTTGWVADNNALGQACLQNGGTEVASNAATWGTTLQPSAAPSQTVGDAWRSELPFDGTFANADWTLTFGVRSVTAAYAGRFKLAVRVWKSSDPNGSNAVELTSGRLASAATSASLTTTADTTIAITWSPGATVVLRGEYLFVNVGVEITSAGSGTTQDIDFRVGSAYTIATSDFVPTPASTGDDVTWFQQAMSAVPALALGMAFVSPNVAVLTPPISPIVNAVPVTPDSSRLHQLGGDASSGSRAIYDVVLGAQPRATIFVSRREAPPVRALGADTSGQTPKTLIADAQAPAGGAKSTASAPEVAPYRLATRAPSSSLAILDRVPSTDAVRDALFVTRRDSPPVLRLGDSGIAQSRALRDAVVAIAPVANAPPLSAPAYLILGEDTSRGTPKPLTLDAQLPQGKQSTTPSSFTFAIERPRLASDLLRGTPKTLIADGVAPFANPQVFAPDRTRPVVDTTRGAAKTLYQDAQLPLGKQSTASAPANLRVLPETSFGWVATLEGVAPAPFIPSVYTYVIERPKLGSDTSFGTALVIRVPQVAPIANVQTFAPDRLRPVVDTSLGTPKALFLDAQAPVGKSTPTLVQQRSAQFSDTSAGVLPLDRYPVGVSATFLVAPQYPASGVDTSTGTPASLLAQLVTAPNSAYTVVDARVLFVLYDATRGTPKTLYLDEFPRNVAPFFAPLMQASQNRDSSYSSRIVLPVIAPITDPRTPWLAVGVRELTAEAAGRDFAAQAASRVFASDSSREFEAVASERGFDAEDSDRVFVAEPEPPRTFN